MERLVNECTRQAEALHTQQKQIQELTSQLQRLHASAAARAAAPPVPDPRLPFPERYSGEPESCSSFLTQCSLFLAHQPAAFPTEQSRVAFVISLLSGRALQWGSAEWDRKSDTCGSFQTFSDALKRVFDTSVSEREASRRLTRISQGNRSVEDYAVEFRTLVSRSKWSPESLVDVFYQGLSSSLKDELAAQDYPQDLEKCISLASRVDRRLRERRRERAWERERTWETRPRPFSPPTAASPRGSSPSAAPTREEPEPMQLGRSKLSAEEKSRRQEGNLCFYCGQLGHFVKDCKLVKAGARQ